MASTVTRILAALSSFSISRRLWHQIVVHRQNADLLGREPGREAAGEVLDQYTTETFHRAERRAVEHHGRCFSLSAPM